MGLYSLLTFDYSESATKCQGIHYNKVFLAMSLVEGSSYLAAKAESTMTIAMLVCVLTELWLKTR